jgi:hypothetical protein
MSEDLVNRLRRYPYDFTAEAADRIEALEQAIRNWAYTIVDWEGIDYVDRIENKKSRFLIESVVAGEKKDG